MPYNPLAIVRRPTEFINDFISRYRAGVRKVDSNIWVMTGFFPIPYHRALGGIFDSELLNALNQRFIFGRLRNSLDMLGFSDIVVVNYYPLLLPVLSRLQPAKVVFHMVDEWQGLPGIPASMEKITEKLLQTADETVVSSRILLDRYSHFAKQITLLRHGTDLDVFEPVVRGKVDRDSRISTLPGRKIGYYGALHKLDYALVRDVAELYPQWSFIFLGPISGSQGLDLEKLSLPKNVIIWEAWPRERLPGFLAALDVFWMPFVNNVLTQAMSPIKLFEVLSAGVPVVSTDLDEVREIGSSHVKCAIESGDHAAKLQKCIESSTVKERKARSAHVASYDWDERMKVFSRLLTGEESRTQ